MTEYKCINVLQDFHVQPFYSDVSKISELLSQLYSMSTHMNIQNSLTKITQTAPCARSIQLAISWTKIRSFLSILGYAFVMTATLPGTKSTMTSREVQACTTIQHVQKQFMGLFQHVPLTVTLLARFQKIVHDISAYIVILGACNCNVNIESSVYKIYYSYELICFSYTLDLFYTNIKLSNYSGYSIKVQISN